MLKIAEKAVLHGKPDLIVSGINHGSNASVNVIYSGTIAAAIEGCIEGVNSIGFSLDDYSWDADFTHVDEYIKKITLEVIEKGLPKDTCLNVNIPALNGSPIKGIMVCRQARLAGMKLLKPAKTRMTENTTGLPVFFIATI